jgi:flagellar biogenesis protein FliO
MGVFFVLSRAALPQQKEWLEGVTGMLLLAGMLIMFFYGVSRLSQTPR